MPPQFLLLGDSHSSAIGDAALARGIPFAGGPIAIGRDLNRDFFDIQDGEVVFRDPATQALYRQHLGEMGVGRLSELKAPLVCTIGFNIARVMRAQVWGRYCLGAPKPERLFVSKAAFEAAVVSAVEGSLAFYTHVAACGVRVFAVLPPQLPVNAEAEFFLAGQAVVAQQAQARGAELVDIRSTTIDEDGLLKPEFHHAMAPGHANVAFGHLILDRLAALEGIG